MMGATSDYQLTVIVPVFNEQDGIRALETKLSDFITVSRVSTCVLFVNDGSTDDSSVRILEACARNKDFYYVEFPRNRGLSSALKAGIDFTESPLLAYIDADLQTDPSDINLLLDKLGNHALATGVRTGRKDSASRRIQSALANGWRRMFTHDGASDTCCPLKLLRTDVAKRLPMFDGMHRFIPALVLLQDSCTYVQVPVKHFPRVSGHSKFNVWNRVFSSFIDCFAYLWIKRRYIRYSVSSSNLNR